MKRNQEAVIADRREAKREKGKQIPEKFMEERSFKCQPVIAKTENQKLFLKSMETDTLSVGRGSSGVGKTYLAASTAANKYLKGEIEEIVLLRPYVAMGRTTGFWPGSILDRLTPYLAPMLNVLRQRLGDGQYQSMLQKQILIQPMEAVRGMDFKKSFVICDEFQNVTKEEVRSLVTRISEGTQLVCIGDDKQADLRQEQSGLMYLVNLIQKHSIPNASVIEFTTDDVVRSGIVGQFVKIFDAEGPIK